MALLAYKVAQGSRHKYRYHPQSNNKKNNRLLALVKLHEISPREQDGRDTLSRYKVQTKAAGLAALEILEDKGVDRVFCDWHDDFVVRKVVNGKTIYHFFQVKTKSKQNAQWSLIELLGVNNTNRKTDSAEAITKSFIGKLLIHTVNFFETCEQVIFITNIYVKDEVDGLLQAISANDYSHKALSKVFKHFEECFCNNDLSFNEKEIKGLISKLAIEQGAEHIKVVGDQFETIARSKIFEYSEIDLQHIEANEILKSLLSLIDDKSTGILPDNLTEKELDNLTGIGLEDLLQVLSLSKIAYESLKEGGDTRALKHLSILQRILKKTGTPDTMIEYAAKCKTEWDMWYMKNRHNVPEYDLKMLENQFSDSLSQTILSGNIFGSLEGIVKSIEVSISNKNSLADLTNEIILGALFSVLVRSQ